jgi:hypothetical protein
MKNDNIKDGAIFSNPAGRPLFIARGVSYERETA